LASVPGRKRAMYLNGVISELEARRNGVLCDHARRPYLSAAERMKLESLPQTELEEFCRPGEVLHAPFSEAEARIIENVVNFKAGVSFSGAEMKRLAE
jgi:hypothetical protein